MEEGRKPTARIDLPGILYCNNAIKRFKRFKNLARHRERWAMHMAFAAPIETVLPKGTKPEHYPVVIPEEINKLIPVVSSDLYFAGVNTAIVWTTEESEYDDRFIRRSRKEKHEADVVTGYLDLPHSKSGRNIELLFTALDQGVGVFEHYRSVAIRRKFNPIHWLAYALNFPIRVLTHAGLGGQETKSKLVVAYAWIVRTMVMVVLLLAAKKFGFEGVFAQMLGKVFK